AHRGAAARRALTPTAGDPRAVGAVQGDAAAREPEGVGLASVEAPAAGLAGAAERGRAYPAHEQHAHPLRRRLSHLHAGVVVAQDLLVAVALPGHAEGSVLAHPDAVPEAAS